MQVRDNVRDNDLLADFKPPPAGREQPRRALDGAGDFINTIRTLAGRAVIAEDDDWTYTPVPPRGWPEIAIPAVQAEALQEPAVQQQMVIGVDETLATTLDFISADWGPGRLFIHNKTGFRVTLTPELRAWIRANPNLMHRQELTLPYVRNWREVDLITATMREEVAFDNRLTTNAIYTTAYNAMRKLVTLGRIVSQM